MYSTDPNVIELLGEERKDSTLNMDWRWNGLSQGIDDNLFVRGKIQSHFFPKRFNNSKKGENVQALMEAIN